MKSNKEKNQEIRLNLCLAIALSMGSLFTVNTYAFDSSENKNAEDCLDLFQVQNHCGDIAKSWLECQIDLNYTNYSRRYKKTGYAKFNIALGEKFKWGVVNYNVNGLARSENLSMERFIKSEFHKGVRRKSKENQNEYLLYDEHMEGDNNISIEDGKLVVNDGIVIHSSLRIDRTAGTIELKDLWPSASLYGNGYCKKVNRPHINKKQVLF